MAPPPSKKPDASKNFFALLSEESEDPQDQLDASTDGGVSLSREPTPRQEFPASPHYDLGNVVVGYKLRASMGDPFAIVPGVHPQDVPPAAPHATSVPSAPSTFAGIPRAPTGPTAFATGPSTLSTPPGPSNPTRGYVPLYGSQPGSYTSPYDVGGKTPGDPRLPASSISVEDFERKYGSGRHGAVPGHMLSNPTVAAGPSRGGLTPGNISFGQMPPVDIPGNGKAPASTTAEQVAPEIPDGVSIPPLSSRYS